MIVFSVGTVGGGRPPRYESEYPARVSLSRINGRYEQASPDRAMSRRLLFSEQYEIGIGSWKATIVRQIDSHGGKVRFRADFDLQDPRPWQRRRMERVSQRLNARRRSSD